MIYRRLVGLVLADAEALATMRRLAVRTVRRNLTAHACDLRTRANLYDVDDPRLADVTGRARRRAS